LSVPPSPAGGNYFALDGEDDYAILDFATFGTLFKEGANEITVEAWVYPTKVPEKGTNAVILRQQVVIYAASPDEKLFDEQVKKEIKEGDMLLIMYAHVAGWGGEATTGFIPMTLSPEGWHHIAFQAQDKQTIWIRDNLSKSSPQGTIIQHDLSKIPEKDFVLGGYGQKVLLLAGPFGMFFWGSFAGYIDEVRISTVPRYDVTKKEFTPKGRFELDADTVALWHFDEPYGAKIFRDSSGNGYHLVGKNGATVRGPFAVNERKKIATSWGAIKANGD
jgi:hypothetical protein